MSIVVDAKSKDPPQYVMRCDRCDCDFTITISVFGNKRSFAHQDALILAGKVD